MRGSVFDDSAATVGHQEDRPDGAESPAVVEVDPTYQLPGRVVAQLEPGGGELAQADVESDPDSGTHDKEVTARRKLADRRFGVIGRVYHRNSDRGKISAESLSGDTGLDHQILPLNLCVGLPQRRGYEQHRGRAQPSQNPAPYHAGLLESSWRSTLLRISSTLTKRKSL